MGEIFFKSRDQLEKQVGAVEEAIEERFIPPSIEGNIFEKTEDELCEHYPARYALYLKALRKKPDISDKEKDSIRKTLGTLNDLDRYIEGIHEEGKEYTLRAHQQTVFEDLRDFLEEGHKEGYIKLPTGAGKTVIFIDFLKATNLKSLIAVPSTVLINQTEKQIQKFAKDISVSRYYGQKKDLSGKVNVITYDSLVAGVNNGAISPDDYDAIILDEVHRCLSDQRMEAVGKFQNSIKIGFTATDVFSLDKKVSNLLPNEIHRMDIREAAEQGILSPLRCYLAFTNVDLSSIKVTGGDYNEKQLEKAINIQSRNKSAVELYKKRFTGHLAVAYCVGVKHATDLASLFQSEGISAVVVSGKTKEKEKEDIFAKYHSGEIKVLCNADILIEGFDEQKASVCLNLRPTLSLVIAEQRGGRVLRLNDDDPNKEAYIVDFLDKNEDKERASIVFPDIVGAAVIPQSGKDSAVGPTKKGTEEEEFPYIEGLRVVTDASEVMRLTGERRYQEPLEDYISDEDLASELGVPLRKIQSVARGVLVERQRNRWDYSRQHVYSAEKFRRPEDGKVREYFSPERANKIRNEFRQAPEGLFTIEELALRFNLTANQLHSDMKEFLPSGKISEYAQLFYRNGELCAYYKLEDIEAIREKIEWKHKEIKPGLISRREVQDAVSYDWMERVWQKRCNEIIDQYPGDKTYRGSYYPKEVIQKINEFLKKYQHPKGWITEKDIIASKNLLDKDAAAQAVNTIVGENPELKHMYLNISDDSELVRYSPSIEGLILDRISFKSLPSGWATETEMEKRFGVAQGSLRAVVIDLMRKKGWRFGESNAHTSWLRQEKTRVLCIDPEATFALENEAYKKGVEKRVSENVESIPDNWITFIDTLISMGVMTKGAIVGTMEQERNKQLERVAELIDRDFFGATQILRKQEGNAVTAYYSPELVDAVAKNRFTIRQSAPRQMLLIADTCKELNMSQEEFLTHVRDIKELKYLGYYQKKKGVVDVYYSKELINRIKELKAN